MKKFTLVSPLLTLIFTRATLPKDWQASLAAHLGSPWKANLFFLDQGIHLVQETGFLLDHDGEKIYCAYGHNRLHGPPPPPDILPGGLANLGGMIRRSSHTLSIPELHWPAQPSQNTQKSIAILIPDHQPAPLLEAARLAAGLAGCNHLPTLYHLTSQRPEFPKAASPYLEALLALGGTIAHASDLQPLALKHEVILQF